MNFRLPTLWAFMEPMSFVLLWARAPLRRREAAGNIHRALFLGKDVFFLEGKKNLKRSLLPVFQWHHDWAWSEVKKKHRNITSFQLGAAYLLIFFLRPGGASHCSPHEAGPCSIAAWRPIQRLTQAAPMGGAKVGLGSSYLGSRYGWMISRTCGRWNRGRSQLAGWKMWQWIKI